MTENGPIWPKMAQIHLNMPKYDPKWPNMAQNGPNTPIYAQI